MNTVTLSLPITARGVDALSKTVGIALNNLSIKIERAPHGSPVQRQAQDDRLELLRIQQALTELMLYIEEENA